MLQLFLFMAAFQLPLYYCCSLYVHSKRRPTPRTCWVLGVVLVSSVILRLPLLLTYPCMYSSMMMNMWQLFYVYGSFPTTVVLLFFFVRPQ